MLLRFLVGLWVSVLLGAAGAPWQTPGACLTPTGTLCRTLQYQASGWVNRSWGVHAIERFKTIETEALRSDGATAVRISRQSFRSYVVRSERDDRARMV